MPANTCVTAEQYPLKKSHHVLDRRIELTDAAARGRSRISSGLPAKASVIVRAGIVILVASLFPDLIREALSPMSSPASKRNILRVALIIEIGRASCRERE